MSILQLEARRDEIRKQIGALLATAKNDNNRLLTDEERATAEKLQADLDATEATLKFERQQAEWDRSAAATPVEPAPQPTSTEPRFESLGEFLQAVRHGYDPRLRAATGMSEGVAADGGFAVQTDFAMDLSQKAYNTGILAQRVRTVEIGPNANGLKLTLVNETSRATSLYGGIITYWLNEAGTKTASQPELRQWDYSLQKLIGLYYATDELLQDATALQSAVSMWFADAFGFKLDDAIYNGTGVGQPLGIMAAPCLVTVSAEPGQLANTIIAENIFKMYERMPPASLPNSVWHINQSCWQQIFQLSLAVGVGGVPMFIPAGGINQAPFGTLMGRPIVPLEHCPALSTTGDISFCDWSQYLAIRKGGIQSASSIHVKFVYDETAFRFVLRYNGAPIPAAALTPYKAPAGFTVSPFIVLESR